MRKSIVGAVAVSSLLFAVVARAELKVGDGVPGLSISKWLQGQAVDLAKAGPDDVYVVEFWATWCGPCRQIIPHMSEMQERFRNRKVTFIGVSNEKQEAVQKFLQNGFDKQMRYTVGIDDAGKTSKSWMEAAKRQGIPCAFVVKGGKIRFIGHPMEELEEKIAELCGDTDRLNYLNQMKKHSKDFQTAVQAENWYDALTALDEVLKLEKDNVSVRFTKYHLLLTKVKNEKSAAEYGASIVKDATDADDLNNIAWQIITNASLEGHRDLKLALSASEKAVKITQEKSPDVIDTYARALAATGDIKNAIVWESKAVDLAKDDKMKKALTETLEGYKKQASAKGA